MNLRRLILASSAATLLVGAAFGCGDGMPDKLRFAGPPQSTMQSGVSVVLQLADATEDRMLVHTYVTNMTNQPMMVVRDGFALRLPDGRILQRRGSNQRPDILAPGQGHEEFVKFEEPGLDLRTVPTASVIIGGISFANDPTPRVVGEIPLTQAGPAN